MCAAVSTDPVQRDDSLLRRAARGDLPEWAVLSAERRAHVARVVELLDEWAAALGLEAQERERWRAAGWLHDALRDADPRELRQQLSARCPDFPLLLLHGPAVAERVGEEVDEEVRAALRYHTIGHPQLGRLGRALYLADFLDPGRGFDREWRASLRARMPHEMDEVLVEVIAARIRHLLSERKPLRPETAAFWSSAVENEP